MHSEDNVIRFEVRDDGRGAVARDIKAGTGLQHIRDRVEALGGQIQLESAAGLGTTVRGYLPLLSATV